VSLIQAAQTRPEHNAYRHANISACAVDRPACFTPRLRLAAAAAWLGTQATPTQPAPPAPRGAGRPAAPTLATERECESSSPRRPLGIDETIAARAEPHATVRA